MHSSCLDPSGDRVFANPPPPKAVDRSKEEYYEQPLGRLPWDDVAVELHPREIVASVGSEVVLIAGVCGPDGYLRTNRRLEWSINQGSVGQFVAVGETGVVDLLVGDFNQPRKITNTFAIGSTLRANTRLNRGTCRPEENVYVLRGQGWISLTSPAEGTSHITVVAPEVYTWDGRLRSSMVHWVDAQWRFPPPAINPAGSKHVFTTSVIRQTNQTPCERWRVRYEITGGPPAGFSPDGVQSVEVPTDSAGQASVEIFQKEPRHGVNQVSIQVIRPGDLPGANGQRLVVGSGTTTKTWTGADLALRASGPAVASPGATLTYRIDVSNPGDIAAKDVVLANAVPDGLTYLNSNPAAEPSGKQLLWRLGELGARQSRTVTVNFRAERQGSVNNCFEVTAAGGLKASTCATTTTTTASIDVRIDGPTQATVGTEARFTITIRNLSQAPATGLVITDRLDQGLQNPAADQDPDHAIKRSLGDLAPGASQPLNVTVRVTKAGRLCQTVEVTGRGITPARTQACVVGVGGAATPGGRPNVGPPPSGESPKPNAGPAAPSVTIKQVGPSKPLSVGEEALFTITILNTGATALKKVEVLDRWDIALTPLKATDGHLQPAGGGLAWMIDTLPAGEKAVIAVLHSCQTAAGKACNRVTVKSADGVKADDEASVEIREAPPPEKPPVEKTSGATPTGGLALTAVGLHSPVTVGKQVTYEIRIKNESPASFRQVAVTATLPDGMTPVSLGTVGPDGIQHTREGQTIRFDVVPEAKSGALLVYRVRALAKKPGRDFRIHVEATAADLTKPLVQEAMTEVIESRQ